MAAAGLARLEGQGTVERWGFEDPACGEKRSLQHWSEKKRKKEEKTYLTYVPANEAMVVVGLARLEGRGMVERWGFEDPACGEKRSLQWSEKKRKKKKIYITLLAYPRMQGVAAAVGVGAKGKRSRRRGGSRAPRRGCSRPSCIGCGGD